MIVRYRTNRPCVIVTSKSYATLSEGERLMSNTGYMLKMLTLSSNHGLTVCPIRVESERAIEDDGGNVEIDLSCFCSLSFCGNVIYQLENSYLC